MTAMIASPGYVNNTYRYPDSGATNHVTSDLNNLTFGIEYHGNNKIHMGNGEGLNISHIGHSVFSSLPFSSRVLYLKNLLCVSLITKNLISVSQFSKDNNVFFEFHHDSCFVKDRITRNILLRGNLHKGLYQFNPTKQQTSNASDHSSNICVTKASKIGILSPSFPSSVSNICLGSFNSSFNV